MKKVFYGCLALFAVLLVALAIFIFLPPAKVAFPEMPVPNGYTILLELALQIKGEAPESKDSDPLMMELFGNKNRDLVEKIRSNLTNKFAVPVEYTENFAAQHLKDLSLVKKAALALANEAKLCISSNRIADAAAIYLDVIKLGINSAEKGLLIDAMVGMACEQIGLRGLESIGNQLNRSLCQSVLQQVIQYQAQALSIEQIFKQEEVYIEQSADWKGRMGRVVMFQSWQKMKQSVTEKYQNRLREKRLLVMKLATQCHVLEKKVRPSKVEELVPVYLKDVPMDPINNTPLPLSFFGD